MDMARGSRSVFVKGKGLVLAIGFACIVVSVLALSAPTLMAEDDAAETKVLTFDGPTPVENLIRAVGEALDVPLIWDPKSRALQNKEVMGKVVLSGTQEQILDGLRSQSYGRRMKCSQLSPDVDPF